MATTDTTNKNVLGAEYLVRDSDYKNIYTPEDLTEEQLMIQDTVRSFVREDVHKNNERLENLEEGLNSTLLEKLGELGILGAHMPEEFGGMALDINTNTVICEEIGPSGGFSATFGAQTGIGMLPLLYYGTEDQKQKYLPKLITGEYKASYCLTEPSSGSDSLAAKSKAVLSNDGTHYVLNGQKMWITNAGFADIFTVFAKIDGEHFTAFILERGMEGLTFGAEEKKLGIKASSTRQVFMENVKVPVDNLLGQIGKGHYIAFNVLNTGRYKIGPMCLGGSKYVNDISIKYANERQQFNTSISSFGAIKHKLGEQAIRVFATESIVYRTSNLIQDMVESLKAEGKTSEEAKLAAAEEYAFESSILKIVSSETLDYVVDEGLQIHGGMGYSEEGQIAQAYRDARINRIFEGTNEINRMLMVSMIMKKAMKGKLDFATPAMMIQSEIMNGNGGEALPSGEYGNEEKAVKDLKKIVLMILGSVGKLAMSGKLDMKTEQEILMNLADMMIDIFLAESTLHRVQKLNENKKGKVDMSVYNSIIKTLIHDSQQRINRNAVDAIASFAKPELHEMFLGGLRKFSNYPLQNVKENRRTVADALIKENGYFL